MYAVIQTGGKQYRVQPGDIFQVEKLEGDVGASVKFDQVLLLSKAEGESSKIWLGKPLVSGAAVEAEIVGQGRGDKIVIVKMKRRKQYRRTKGHRQFYTQLLVTGLDNGSGEKVNLSAEDRKNRLNRFQSHLKPRGLGATPKTLGSRKRLAAQRSAGGPGKSAAPAGAAQASQAPKKAAGTASAKKPAASKAKKASE
jgi:large subunit ribosomal protein L21